MASKRKIAIVTSSRADYAHLRWLLHDLARHPAVKLHVIALGPHLSPIFGHTGGGIAAAHVTPVECLLDSDTDVGMAKTIGVATLGVADALARIRPDILLIIADRYEMLAPAMAALALRIPIAHVEGGEALGAEVRGRKAGTIAEAGLFAFYPNKQITTGESGVLVTSNKRIAATAERLRNQGRNPAFGLNQHAEIGFSYRLSDINCALGISQLQRIESTIARRQMLAESYARALAHITEVVSPRLTSPLGRISWFAYPVCLGPNFTAKHRDQVCAAMLEKGIGTGKYFAPLHRQLVLRDSATRRDRLPNTEAVADRVIALPFFSTN